MTARNRDSLRNWPRSPMRRMARAMRTSPVAEAQTVEKMQIQV